VVNITITIRGVNTITQNMEVSRRALKDALGSAMYREAEYIMTKAKRRVPVDTAALRNSGFVDAPTNIGSGNTIVFTRFGFGGVATKVNPSTGVPTTSYALYVHEINRPHRVGTYKFLEHPVNEEQGGSLDRISRRIKRYFR
jgi:hypothetical protein